MELVTGKAGKPHVSSADDGRRIAGEVGSGSYVLATGGRCAPSLVDSNTIRIATGDLILQGRHVGITEPEDVKVASGTQGKKRRDYVCVRYKRDVGGRTPTLVETVEWTVLRGTPGNNPTAPSVPRGSIMSGDADVTIPVASVDFNGMTTQQPSLLVPVLKPLADVWDSVSQRLWSGRATSCELPEAVSSYGRLVVLVGGDESWIRTCVTVIPAAGDNFTVTYSHRNTTHVYLRHADLAVSGRTLRLSNQTQEWLPLAGGAYGGGSADGAFYILGVWRAA